MASLAFSERRRKINNTSLLEEEKFDRTRRQCLELVLDILKIDVLKFPVIFYLRVVDLTAL